MPLDNSIFKKPAKTPQYRLTLNTEGLERAGKTHFAINAPGKIGVLILDPNTENIATKAQAIGKDIICADFVNPNPLTNPLAKYVLPLREKAGAKAKAATTEMPLNFHKERWDAILQAWFMLTEDSTIGTIVIDTGTELYSACRLALFGKLKGVVQRDYGESNAELKTMLAKVKQEGRKNLIIPHRLSKLYKASEWDGKSYAAKGWGEMPFECQMTVRHTCTLVKDEENPNPKAMKPSFVSTVIDCSDDPNLRGLELSDESNNFATLAGIVYPDAPESLWV